MILRHFPELYLSLDSRTCRNDEPVDVIGKHAQELVQLRGGLVSHRSLVVA